MPNIDGGLLLLIIALMVVASVITYFIMNALFNAKLNHIKQQEKTTMLQSSKEVEEGLEKINQLKQEQQQLTKENTQLSNHLATTESDLKNLKVRIEEYRVDTHQLMQQLRIAEKEKTDLQVELTQKVEEQKHLNAMLVKERNQIEELNEKFQKEFENLAQKILDEKSQKFAVQNKENLELILNPLQDKIKFFEKRVEDTHKESLTHGARLQQQIMGLKELNQKMSQEANNLTKALKGESKTQGNWGEMILESVLEKSGLRKDYEYVVQSSHKNEEGKRLMPDVIIQLPGNKKMIIDAKVSLTAYEKYVNTTHEQEKEQFINLHLQSIQRHVQQLSKKSYQHIHPLDSPDFVLLFIPIESAFALASQAHPSLYQDAFDLDIILVTPTTLLAVLRTIDSMWQNEKQKQNAIDIATQAGKLYDTFVNLLSELERVGRQMDTAKGSYDNAMKKLTGKRSLFKNIEKLKKLGAKTHKQIDEKYIHNVNQKDEEE